jgi:hypothetical protein
MLPLNDCKNLVGLTRLANISPIMEEGLLIGIAIVAILIVLGIVFGVFDWIAESFGSLFDQF